jgi:hypothetical protein
MASNYQKEPVFLLECRWDDTTKLPEKYKFQGEMLKQRSALIVVLSGWNFS